MSQSSQLSQLTQETKISFLSETFSDYGLEAILSELIDFVLAEYPNHFARLSSYLIPARNHATTLNNREYYRIEMNYSDFTDVEDNNG